MNEENFFEIIHLAAILIQKIWRGYRTRKILSYYITAFINNQQEQEENLQEVIPEEEEDLKINKFRLKKSNSFDLHYCNNNNSVTEISDEKEQFNIEKLEKNNNNTIESFQKKDKR